MIKPRALVWGGRKGTGDSASAPFMALSVRSMPSLGRTYTIAKGRGAGRGAGDWGGAGAPGGVSRRRAPTCASVTAPSPGAPTAPCAGRPARDAPPTPPITVRWATLVRAQRSEEHTSELQLQSN